MTEYDVQVLNEWQSQWKLTAKICTVNNTIESSLYRNSKPDKSVTGFLIITFLAPFYLNNINSQYITDSLLIKQILSISEKITL